MSHDKIKRAGKLVRSPGIKYNWTKEELYEYGKCLQDPIYFIEKYVKITTVDKGITEFKLYDYQKEFIQTLKDNRFVISNFARQSGKSTCVVGFIVWYILFHQSVNVAILAHKKDAAKNTFKRLKTAYENLPFFLQQGVLEWNIESIKLENESFVMCAATTEDSIRSMSANFIFLDEFAHVKHGIAEAFYTSSYPALTSGVTTRLCIVSTPNGLNLFHKLWADANRPEGHPQKNGFKSILVKYDKVPEYPGGPLRGSAWREETIKQLGSESQFLQEFECSFIGSVNTLINSKKLAELVSYDPIEITKEGWKIFERPNTAKIYIATVDVSRGVNKDFSAITIFDATEKPYKVVATWKNNSVPHLELPAYIVNGARMYNNAHVLCETNDIGGVVAYMLNQNFEYENILQTKNGFSGSFKLTQGFGLKNAEFGVKTTKTVKKIGCDNLKTFVENDQLLINDYSIILELMSFVSKRDSWEADDGHNDDQVMTLVLFSWLVRQEEFIDIVKNYDTIMKSKKIISSADQEPDPKEILRPILDDRTFRRQKFVMDGCVWETDSDEWG